MCIFEYIEISIGFFSNYSNPIFVPFPNKRITSQKVHHPRDGFVKRHGTNSFDLGHSVSRTNHINFDEGILRNSVSGGGVTDSWGPGNWNLPWNFGLKNRKIGSPSNKSEDTSPMLCSK